MDPWTALILIGLSVAISIAMMPKPQVPQPEKFEDIDFPQADEGTPQAVIFGDVWSGNWTVLAVGNYRTNEIKSGGGKK